MSTSRFRTALLTRGGVYLVALAIQTVATLAAVPILSRILTPSQFGFAVSGMILIQLTWVISSWGLPAAITRQFLVEDGGQRQARRLVTLSLGLSALTGTALLALSSLWAPLFGLEPLSYSTVVVCAAGAVLAVVNATQALHRAQGRAGRFATSVALSAGLGNATGVALVLTTTPRHEVFLTGLLGGYLVAAVVGLAWSKPLPPSQSDTAALTGLALPTLPHMIGVYLISSQDRLIVSYFLGSEQVGRYQAAFFAGGATLIGLNAINNAWTPQILQAPAEEQHELTRKSTRALAWLVGAGVFGTVLLAPVGLRIAAPAEYDHSSLLPVVTVLALNAVPALVYLSFSHSLYKSGRFKVFIVASPAAALLGFLVAWSLIDATGLVGVAIGALTSQVMLATIIALAARRSGAPSRLLRQASPAAALALGAVLISLTRELIR